jgi:hypothetical protein
LKRRVLQSLFDFDLATEIRQDPAVCVSLPSNSIVKEQNSKIADTNSTRGGPPVFSETTRPPPVWPVRNHESFESFMPCEGGEAVWPANEAV